MQDTPLHQPAVNESEPVSLPTAPRRMSKPLILGLLAGVIPVGLAAVYLVVQPIQTFILSLLYFTDWWLLLLGFYGGGWVGANLLRRVSHQQSTRVFAKGMRIGLATSMVIALCVVVILVLWALVAFASCTPNCGW